MDKLLLISGPTASGKTSLALKLAKKYNGVLISADSRQIYKGLDIGTGKDKPKDTTIHLLDLITPDQSFSVAQYQNLVLPLIKKIQEESKLPILIGGTGQYSDSVINPHKDTFHIKPKKLLRKILNTFPTSFLRSILKLINKNLYLSLNNSERNNPHRLIRKIEISLSFSRPKPNQDNSNHNYLHLSLTAPNEFLYQRIDSRVDSRLKQGLLKEIKNLLKKYPWSSPGLDTLAYKDLKPYFDNQDTLESCVKKWSYKEHSYAKRQKTWFKKMPHVHFIDISTSDPLKESLALIDSYLSS